LYFAARNMIATTATATNIRLTENRMGGSRMA
jgi:hypothetical protein